MADVAERKTGVSWHWERRDPRVSGVSGDLAKLFRNETVKTPGALNHEAPSTLATTIAREVVQNAWDAARELRTSEPGLPRFRLEFHFRRYDGAEKIQLVRRLGLHDLERRVRHIDRQGVGLGPTDCLDSLSSDGPLNLLEVRERGASGMYGRFDDPKSKLFLALAAVGVTNKAIGSGGSFGYGKAGLIRGSSIHSVYAYTCFRERADDIGVTRRFLGMTYWGAHEVDGVAFSGFSRFGAERDGWIQPLENEAADRVAEAVQLPIRKAMEDDDLGTSLLLVDPTIGASDLCNALERNWWPAIIDNAFVTTVIDYDGKRLVPRPRKNRLLSSFVRAYELAVTAQDAEVDSELSKSLGNTRAVKGAELPVGRIGLVADAEGWSIPRSNGAADDESERSIVALVRSPRMVVQYLDVGSRAPFVRGVFVASDPVDDLLRQTEPKGHDEWQTFAGEEGVEPTAHRVAASVHQKIRQAVADFRRKVKPPPPAEDAVVLPLLQSLLRRLSRESGPAILPTIDKRDSIVTAVHQELQPGEEPGTVRVVATLTAAVRPGMFTVSPTVAVELSYRFQEDDRVGSECRATLHPPAGFRPEPGSTGRIIGQLTEVPKRFELHTDSYSGDWTGRLIANVVRVEASA